ncbi:MAG: hypothetical protein IJ054_06050 [Lachnospiraceae bacterium]|nr:hypothetical protein [Lachnospiraceae bacterium]
MKKTEDDYFKAKKNLEMHFEEMKDFYKNLKRLQENQERRYDRLLNFISEIIENSNDEKELIKYSDLYSLIKNDGYDITEIYDAKFSEMDQYNKEVENEIYIVNEKIKKNIDNDILNINEEGKDAQ